MKPSQRPAGIDSDFSGPIGTTPSITPIYLGEGTQCLVCVFLKKKYKKEAACHGRTLKHGAHLSCFLLLELTPDVVLI